MIRLLPSLFLALLVGVAAQAANSDLANGVMVIVNDSIITYKDVVQYVGPSVDLLIKQYASQPSVLEQRIQDAQRDGVEQLVERKLILHEFSKAGYNLPESIIEDRVKARIRERYGDNASLTRSLQSQGMTYAAWKQQIREDFIVAAMTSKNISQETIISPHKIEKYYAENLDKFKVEDQVRLRMIVLNKPAKGDATPVHRLADEVLAKLKEGAAFAEMAGIYSDGSQRAQGGDWGWVERSVLRKELGELAFSLKPGQRSDVVDLPGACYIMLVEDVKANHVQVLPEVRDAIERTLITQEQSRLRKQWIDRLKNKSFVRYF